MIVFLVIYFLFLKPKAKQTGEGELQTDVPAPAEKKLNDKVKEYEEVEGLKFFNPAQDDIEAIFDDAVGEKKKKPALTAEEENFTKQSEKATKTLDDLLNKINAVTDSSSSASAASSPVVLATPPATDDKKDKTIKDLESKVRRLENEVRLTDLYKKMTGAYNPSIGDTNPDRDQDRHPMLPVKPVKRGNRRDVVSSLSNMPRRSGFYGLASEQAERNTIRATTYGKQIIESGQNVRVRTAEPMQVGSQILPAGSILTGVGTVAVDRLYISFSTVEYNGVLTAVSLEAYDADGIRGLFVPGSMEMDAIRELGTELATSLSQTASQNISVIGSTQSAAEELKKNLGQGTIQGVG
ncbi:MAG: conjugative transposon protein TraM, partial [Bacteroidales bacterium]|nr:conjugative transposon protein TraM [Bacteroidales bacterium]